MSKTPLKKPGRAAFWFACAAAFALGCGPPEHLEVTHVRTVDSAEPARPGATHADRFGRETPGDHGQHQGAAQDRPIAEVLRDELEWQVPEGWVELEAGGMRIASLRPAGNPDADCSLIILSGSGGGIEGNVNRWRGQLGLEPQSAAEIVELPTQELLGQRGVLVDLDGTYTGMGGPEREGWHLRGVIWGSDEFTLFLKMTAPRDVAEAEREAFDEFCKSLRLRSAPTDDSGAGGGGGELTYTTPSGWNDAGARSMRAVNLSVGSSECFVILLGGEAGGLLGNLNRWRGQIGLGPLDAADLEDLERVEILGQQAPLLDVRGDYTGMGDENGTNYRMFGIALIRRNLSVFVKMIGPEDELEAQRAAFLDFVASLEEA